MMRVLRPFLAVVVLILVSRGANAQAPNWYSLSGPFDVSVRAIAEDSAVGVYASADSIIYGGFLWTPVFTQHAAKNAINALVVPFHGVIFAGSTGGVFGSGDSGRTWSTNFSLAGTINSFAKSNSGILAAGDRGISSATLTNPTFTKQTQLPVTAITRRADNSVLAAQSGELVLFPSDLSTFHSYQAQQAEDIMFVGSDRHGDNFIGYRNIGFGRVLAGSDIIELSNSGMKPQTITGMVTTSGDSLFVATADSGIYLSTDRGSSWQSFNMGLETKQVTSLAIGQTGYLYAGTINFGVYRSDKQFANIPEGALGVVMQPRNDNSRTLSYDPSTRSIQFTASSTNESLRIYDLLGRNVLTTQLGETVSHIALPQALSTRGMYFVDLRSNGMDQVLKLSVDE